MMNSQHNRADILQDRFALKAIAYLSAANANLPHDVTERLRAARAQALGKRKITSLQVVSSINASGGNASLSWGKGNFMGWWGLTGSLVPLVALVVGLMVIDTVQTNNRMLELAEVDSALLVDDLPPAAFSDPGFVQFLKVNR